MECTTITIRNSSRFPVKYYDIKTNNGKVDILDYTLMFDDTDDLAVALFCVGQSINHKLKMLLKAG